MVIFEICQSERSGLWHWKLIKRNGYIVATSQNFDKKEGARASIDNLLVAINDQNILIREQPPKVLKKRGRKKR